MGNVKFFLSWVYSENTVHSQLIIKQDVGNCHILRQSAGWTTRAVQSQDAVNTKVCDC